MPGLTVEVLLLTHNRESVLGELLDSLLAQSFTDWRILARDNGSSDGSFEHLERFQRAHPQRMMLTDDRGVNLGAKEGFARLLAASAASYAMFCDCDDVWLPQKIERTLECMRQIEQCHSPGTPLLVHTDLRVTDARLTVLSDSFCAYEKLNPPRGATLNRLLSENQVTGCTAMVNRPLRDLALPIPAGRSFTIGGWRWSPPLSGPWASCRNPPSSTASTGKMPSARGSSPRGTCSVKPPASLRDRGLRRAVAATARQAEAFLAPALWRQAE